MIQRFPQRSLYLIVEALFISGCAIVALSGDVVSFGAGHVLIGFATGLLLVIALPPVVQRFPAQRLPVTAAVINIGFFGAISAGPLIGGGVALAHEWRLLYAGLALLGLIAFGLALFTLPDKKPQNPQMPFDYSAILLGLFATVLPFWASGELVGHGFGSVYFIAPLILGTACFVALLVVQYHRENALAPVKPLWKTVPVAGILVAMFGGAALVTFMDLAVQFELRVAAHSGIETGLLFWPNVAGTILAAALLGVLVRSRYLPVLALAGMVVLAGAGGLMAVLPEDGAPVLMLAIAGLLGFGAGATVAPGLWLAGFCLPSTMIGRLFALIELVRSEADFIMAPVVLQVARNASASMNLTSDGVHEATWVAFGVTVAATLGILAVWLTGGAKLRSPDIEGWLDKDRPERLGLESPPLGAALRSQV